MLRTHAMTRACSSAIAASNLLSPLKATVHLRRARRPGSIAEVLGSVGHPGSDQEPCAPPAHQGCRDRPRCRRGYGRRSENWRRRIYARAPETRLDCQVAWRCPARLLSSVDELLVRNDVCHFRASAGAGKALPRGVVPLRTHLHACECNGKGEYRRIAAELGFIVVCPDTSPRGADIPDEKDNWQFGTGAGFYLDARQEPYAKNYRMYSYIVEELPAVIGREFPADMGRQSIFGHSMGGHGALTIALKNPARFRSCSASRRSCNQAQPAGRSRLSKNISAWMRPRGGAAMPLRSSRTDTVSRNSWSIRGRQTVSSRRASGLGCSKTRAPRQAFR